MHARAVGQRTEGKYTWPQTAGFVMKTLYRWNDRSAARGKHQHVIRFGQSPWRIHFSRHPVYRTRSDTAVKGNPALLMPGHRINEDVCWVLCSGKHSGQTDPAITTARFISENHDIEHGGAGAGEHFLDEPLPGHPVANHHEPLLFNHAVLSLPRLLDLGHARNTIS